MFTPKYSSGMSFDMKNQLSDVELSYNHSFNKIFFPLLLILHLASQGFFSVQFYTKTAVLNGFVQFWAESCAVLKMT